jgi:hypothetical protein
MPHTHALSKTYEDSSIGKSMIIVVELASSYAN